MLRHVVRSTPIRPSPRWAVRPHRRSVWLTLTILAASATRIAAQGTQAPGTLAGTVKDAASGEALQGVIVQIGGSQLGTVTRSDGSYRLQLTPGNYEVRARFIGYTMASDSVAVASGETATKDFQLSRSSVSLNELIVTGTRRADRTVIDAPAPIDVFTTEEVRMTGRVETNQILQALAPSFNFPRASVSDGTDHVRPATLRGLNPDQVLVLINGKRRHTTALVNVNNAGGAIGRGSAAVDLNAIPAAAIERIEVLRDGAAAQYGSDAIAGVINIILKSNTPDEVSATLGQTKLGDGELAQVDANYTLGLGTEGFLNLTGEFRDRGATNRSRADTRVQYFPGDPRNASPPFDLRNHRQGDAAVQDASAFLNGSKLLGSGVTVYSFGGFQRRKGDAAGFFRRASDDRNVRAIYPNGFLPLIESRVLDGSGALGLKGSIAGWAWDLSGVYGRNTFDFDVTSSVNVSLGANSPTEFYAGRLGSNQLTTNLDFVRAIPVRLHSPLNIAIGGEYRRDAYWIEPGEYDSYRDGGERILDGPNAGRQPQIGAQVFPGFRPADAVDESRRSFAGYIDLEANLTSALLLGIAGRHEDYSDFGSTTTGKIAARVEVSKNIVYRATASTGFRAPSLGQSWFSSTATNFIVVNGVNTPFDIRTFPVSSSEARILGAEPLKAEKSENYSIGMAFEPVPSFALTVDGYRILIEDRIVLSGNFIGSDIQALLEAQGFRGVNGGRFFTNAIDTRTHGVDVVVNWGLQLPDASTLRLTAGYNRNKTKVKRVAATPPQLGQRQEILFDRVERARMELGAPGSNAHLTATYRKDRLGWSVNAVRYGEVWSFGTSPTGADDQMYRKRWVVDANVSYRLRSGFGVTVGADNLLDVYPDENKPSLSNSGIFPYTGLSPFGFNGTFYYVRLAYTR